MEWINSNENYLRKLRICFVLSFSGDLNKEKLRTAEKNYDQLLRENDLISEITNGKAVVGNIIISPHRNSDKVIVLTS